MEWQWIANVYTNDWEFLINLYDITALSFYVDINGKYCYRIIQRVQMNYWR